MSKQLNPKPNSMWLVVYECRYDVIKVSPQGDGFFAPGQEPCWHFRDIQEWVKEITTPEQDEIKSAERTDHLKVLQDHKCACWFENGKLLDECHWHACARTGTASNGDPKSWISKGVDKKFANRCKRNCKKDMECPKQPGNTSSFPEGTKMCKGCNHPVKDKKTAKVKYPSGTPSASC